MLDIHSLHTILTCYQLKVAFTIPIHMMQERFPLSLRYIDKAHSSFMFAVQFFSTIFFCGFLMQSCSAHVSLKKLS